MTSPTSSSDAALQYKSANKARAAPTKGSLSDDDNKMEMKRTGVMSEGPAFDSVYARAWARRVIASTDFQAPKSPQRLLRQTHLAHWQGFAQLPPSLASSRLLSGKPSSQGKTEERPNADRSMRSVGRRVVVANTQVHPVDPPVLTRCGAATCRRRECGDWLAGIEALDRPGGREGGSGEEMVWGPSRRERRWPWRLAQHSPAQTMRMGVGGWHLRSLRDERKRTALSTSSELCKQTIGDGPDNPTQPPHLCEASELSLGREGGLALILRGFRGPKATTATGIRVRVSGRSLPADSSAKALAKRGPSSGEGVHVQLGRATRFGR
uniref:Uncharacterized protein n=1 Tax=Mycena chlorophos TaxID=658473 RepID=A0ABQ0L8B3_MYCCL|nr:predicted protein [Mycena chlorophos]